MYRLILLHITNMSRHMTNIHRLISLSFWLTVFCYKYKQAFLQKKYNNIEDCVQNNCEQPEAFHSFIFIIFSTILHSTTTKKMKHPCWIESSGLRWRATVYWKSLAELKVEEEALRNKPEGLSFKNGCVLEDFVSHGHTSRIQP